ncbi:hypothetical protein ZWY2020_010351 [Hordeum vulgare]|nr:hypothetical protein ZWY2020_010351 [Hordeum vulgare]
MATTANPTTDLFARLSFRRAGDPTPFRFLPADPTPRVSVAIVASTSATPSASSTPPSASSRYAPSPMLSHVFYFRIPGDKQRPFSGDWVACARKERDSGMMRVQVEPPARTSEAGPVVDLINSGAVGVIPTDTVYSIVCDLSNNDSIERLRRIKGIVNSKYTFILPATKELPKQCIKHGSSTRYAKRRQVGVRMPDDPICQAILQNLEEPLICTSVKNLTEDEWILDPVTIADIYEPLGLDFIVDGGARIADPSTVVDMTGSYPTIIRQGKGAKLDWMVTGTDQEVQ